MIENINGTRETVNFGEHGVYKLYMNDEYEDYPNHWHTPIEIIMPLQNDYRVECGGVDYHLNEQDILVISSCALHTLYAPENGVRIIFQIDFTPLNVFKDTYTMMNTFEPARLISKETAPDIYEEAHDLICEIKNEYQASQPLSDMYVFCKITEFFVLLGRKYLSETRLFENDSHKRKEYADIFMSIFDYISIHCTENLTLEDIASIAGFSKFHFSRLFKQFTNTTFNNYVNTKRVEYAERLLIDPTLSITEISYLSGFNSSSAFVRVFKSIKTYTPSEFRKLHDCYVLTECKDCK